MSEAIGAVRSQDSQGGEPLPASVLARQKFQSLERWLYCRQVSTAALRQVELTEELEGREMLRLLLQGHIDCRGDGDVGPAVEVLKDANSKEHELYACKRLHTRTMVTIFGLVAVSRIGYGKDKHTSIHPLDEVLQLPCRRYSYETQRRLVKKAIQGPFDEVTETHYEATGMRIPKRSVEEIVIEASTDFDRFYEHRKGNGTNKGGSILVGSVDGKGIPMVKQKRVVKNIRRGKGEKAQKKKMATVAAVFTQRPHVRTPEEVVNNLFDSRKEHDKKGRKRRRPERKRVWASLTAEKDAFIRGVKLEMDGRDPAGIKIHVVVTDGERGLQRRVREIIKGAIFVLDFLHVLEKLWAAGNALYGERTKEAEEFVRRRALRILCGQVSQVVKGLRQIVTKRNLKGQKEKALLTAANYYYRNRPRMRYNEYLEKGLPIASGSVEGACKNLIKDRMERSGMRWTPRMAEAMVKMRAVYRSGDFEEYWNYHVGKEQQRLYPKDRWRSVKRAVRK